MYPMLMHKDIIEKKKNPDSDPPLILKADPLSGTLDCLIIYSLSIYNIIILYIYTCGYVIVWSLVIAYDLAWQY